MGELCTICLNNMSLDSTILPCSHQFCTACIQEWLANNTCPECRQVIVPEQPVQQDLQDVELYIPDDYEEELNSEEEEYYGVSDFEDDYEEEVNDNYPSMRDVEDGYDYEWSH